MELTPEEKGQALVLFRKLDSRNKVADEMGFKNSGSKKAAVYAFIDEYEKSTDSVDLQLEVLSQVPAHIRQKIIVEQSDAMNIILLDKASKAIKDVKIETARDIQTAVYTVKANIDGTKDFRKEDSPDTVSMNPRFVEMLDKYDKEDGRAEEE